jgi:hypothetical protein
MIPNNIRISESGIKFCFSWDGPIHARGYILCAGRDSEFVTDRRCFFVPVVGATGCMLDMGGGPWFFRIGCITGGERGHIQWSNIYGPMVNTAAGTKPVPPLPKSDFKLMHSQSIMNGLRGHIQSTGPYIMICESSRDTSLPASGTEWTYHIDSIGRGFIDILNLQHPHTYFVRYTALSGSEFPNDRIVSLCGGLKHSGIPQKPLRSLDNTIRSIASGDRAVLRQTENVRNMRFSSHADYLRYQAALARVSSGSS